MKKLIIFLIILPLFLNANNAGDTVITKIQLYELNTKINKLESNIDDNCQALKKAETMIDISKEYSESADKFLNKGIPIVSISIAFMAFLFAFFGFKGIKQLIDNRLNLILKDKEKIILELINKHSNQKHLLLRSKILLLNKVGTTVNENLMTVLENNCNEYKSKDIPDIIAYKFKNEKYDMVILDNTNLEKKNKNWDFNDESLKGTLSKIVNDICAKDVAFLYFGSKDLDGSFSNNESLNKYAHLINFANSPSTAYTNILNLLSFRELLKK